MAIQGIAIFLITLLLVWQSSAATLDSTGPKEQDSDLRIAADSETSGSSAAAAAKNSGRGGTGDLVAALEKIAGGQIGTAKSVRRSAGNAAAGGAAGRLPAAATAAAADLYETSLGQDDALLAELDRIEARVRDAAPSTESEAGDGNDDDERLVTADDLCSLLDLLGKVSRRTGDASDDSVQTGRQNERRMFTNSGGRGKKEEPNVEEAAIGDADVRGVVRELAGIVHELAVRYVAQKERTDRVLTILAKIVESLVSPRGD